jgi:hypothetical protein
MCSAPLIVTRQEAFMELTESSLGSRLGYHTMVGSTTAGQVANGLKFKQRSVNACH